jgi:hypothetical protein
MSEGIARDPRILKIVNFRAIRTRPLDPTVNLLHYVKISMLRGMRQNKDMGQKHNKRMLMNVKSPDANVQCIGCKVSNR